MRTHAIAIAALFAAAPGVPSQPSPSMRRPGRAADSLMVAARAELDTLLVAVRPLVTKLTGDTDVVRGVRTLRAGGAFVFPSQDSVLDAYRVMTRRAERLVGLVIAEAPAPAVEVAPYPEEVERRGGPPSYAPARAGTDDVPRFLVNRLRMERMSVADAVAHEAWPGHHVQLTAAAAAAPTPFNGDFVEGWGVYAETLADDMGLYSDPLSRAGYLVHLVDVALACYLDIGRRQYGWTRDQLIDSMMILAGRPRAQAEVYADRHAQTPGQLATYFVGYRAFREARRNAERQLGAAFSLPKFNRELIRHGSMPLDSIPPLMSRWADSVRAAGKSTR